MERKRRSGGLGIQNVGRRYLYFYLLLSLRGGEKKRGVEITVKFSCIFSELFSHYKISLKVGNVGRWYLHYLPTGFDFLMKSDACKSRNQGRNKGSEGRERVSYPDVSIRLR